MIPFRCAQIVWLMCIAAVAAVSSRAQSVYEPFAYTGSSSLTGQSGGTGFSGGWQYSSGTAPTVNGSGLSVSSLVTSGNAVSFSGAGEMNRSSTASIGVAGQTVWLGLLLRENSSGVSSNNYAGFTIGDSNTPSGAQRLFVGFIGNQLGVVNYNGDFSGSASYAAINATANATYFAAIELTFSTATQATLNLYINPTPGGSPGTPINGTPISQSFLNTNTFSLVSSNGLSTTYDEIRIGSSFASIAPSAIPEPSTYALWSSLAALGGALVWRRRRLPLTRSVSR